MQQVTIRYSCSHAIRGASHVQLWQAAQVDAKLCQGRQVSQLASRAQPSNAPCPILNNPGHSDRLSRSRFHASSKKKSGISSVEVGDLTSNRDLQYPRVQSCDKSTCLKSRLRKCIRSSR